YLPRRKKHPESDDVAGKVHHFCMGGCSYQRAAQQQHEGHGPERAGSRPEKAVIEADRESEKRIEYFRREPGMDILGAEFGGEEHVSGYDYQKPGHQMPEDRRVETLNGHHPCCCTGGCPEYPADAVGKLYLAASDKVEHGASRAERGLQLIGA